jgi:hypothetical protein
LQRVARLRKLECSPSFWVSLSDGKAAVDIVALRPNATRLVRAKVHHNVVMDRAGNGARAAFAGIVDLRCLICEVVRVEAAGAVAKVRDVVGGITTVGCKEGHSMYQEGCLRASARTM